MKHTIQVRILRGEKMYVAECLDLPVVTEAPTFEELTTKIREAIGLHLEDEDLTELGIAPDATVVANMETALLPESLLGELRHASSRARKDPLRNVAGICDVEPFSANSDEALYGC